MTEVVKTNKYETLMRRYEKHLESSRKYNPSLELEIINACESMPQDPIGPIETRRWKSIHMYLRCILYEDRTLVVAKELNVKRDTIKGHIAQGRRTIALKMIMKDPAWRCDFDAVMADENWS